MKLPVRTASFGAFSGLLWSAAPIWFSNRSFDTIKPFPFAGIMAGILISVVLYKPLLKFNRWGVFLLGLLALPLGAFCFGACLGLLGYPANGSFSGHVYNAFYWGSIYTYMTLVISLLSCCGLILFPAAVLTTYLLRWTITPKSPPTVQQLS